MVKPLKWYLRRHPLLYKIRFFLVSKNASWDAIESYCYNDLNSKKNIAPLFYDINNLIFSDSDEDTGDLEKAKIIAIWLRNKIKGGPGLGKSSEKALQVMINGNGGVCSDFSQIYNNFCVINDIKVKEWGIKNTSKDKSVTGGHSYNEVYSKELKKWIMIDITKSIVFFHNNQNTPLSSLEFIKLKREKKEITVFNINENKFIDEIHIKNIFLTNESIPFLITNYNNKIYDSALKNLYFFPESIIHCLLFLIGKSYAFEFPINEKLKN